MNRKLRAIVAAIACAGTITSAAELADVFEVAAIRQNLSGGMNTQIDTSKAGRLIVENASVKTLIRNAYGLLSFQFTGGPNWMDSDRYDIAAKTESAGKITPEDLKPLLRNLLADRFHLKIHWETREEPEYGLVSDKIGLKIQPHADAPGHGMDTRKGPGKVLMKGIDVPVEELASNLANQLGRFVVDETGLPGNYDFVLEWDPDQTGDTPGPSLFTAVREQLGLRLEARKGPVRVLVIDSVERPSAN